MPAVSPAVVTLDDSPVDYVILYRQPATLNGDEAGWRSSYTFGVAAADHDDFCVFLAGGNPIEIDLGGSTAFRHIPCSDPYRTDLICKKISSVFTGSYTDSNPAPLKNWSHAKVTVEFGSVPYPTDGSTPFMTIGTRAAPEAITLAGRQLKHSSDSTPIQADAAISIAAESMSITIFNAVYDQAADVTLAATYRETVNSDSLFGIYPAYTLRYDGMDRQVTRTATGQTTCQKTYYFYSRSIDLRKVLRPNGLWDFAVKPDTSYIYTAVPYAPLFA